MREYLAVALLVCAALPAAAQPAALLRGRVVRASDGTPLANAMIVVEAGRARVGAHAGAAGAFLIRVPALPARVIATRLAFRPETLLVARADTGVVLRLADAPVSLAPALVQATADLSMSSGSVARELDLQLRPRQSSQELLRLVPGLVIAQHAGGGKAEQIFLRGFDADHGTDVALDVDGVPVNMVSHAHGQGYADLHFLLPEVVERVEVRKGPYDVRDGDFATAGAVSLVTRDRIAGPAAELRVGSFGARRAVALLPFGSQVAGGGYVAAGGGTSDGPFEHPQQLRTANAFAKWSTVAGGADLSVAGLAYDARWDASGQLPARAVLASRVSRFGAIDPTEGGDTRRVEARVRLRAQGSDRDGWEASAFAVRYRFRLFSNFTFFLRDSLQGDGIEQSDERTVLGAQGWLERQARWGALAGSWRAQAGARYDDAHVSLFHQVSRRRIGVRSDALVRQAHLFGGVRQRLAIGARTTLEVGARGDAIRFRVLDVTSGAAPEAAVRWGTAVSPRGSLSFAPSRTTTLFANVGGGFHSNDARQVAASDGARVLPRALGAEVGARHTRALGTLAAALWRLDLASELVYVGDEGTIEASGPTRRIGVDLEGRLRLAPWLWADADVSLSRGRAVDAPPDERYIPLAPTLTSTGGLTVHDAEASPAAGVRYRRVSARPADARGEVRATGHALWELFARRDFGPIAASLTLDNVLNATWNEAQFATTSRLRDEAAPVTDLHFTPGAPRTVQLTVSYRFRGR